MIKNNIKYLTKKAPKEFLLKCSLSIYYLMSSIIPLYQTLSKEVSLEYIPHYTTSC